MSHSGVGVRDMSHSGVVVRDMSQSGVGVGEMSHNRERYESGWSRCEKERRKESVYYVNRNRQWMFDETVMAEK